MRTIVRPLIPSAVSIARTPSLIVATAATLFSGKGSSRQVQAPDRSHSDAS
jgi:hypothetical protein